MFLYEYKKRDPIFLGIFQYLKDKSIFCELYSFSSTWDIDECIIITNFYGIILNSNIIMLYGYIKKSQTKHIYCNNTILIAIIDDYEFYLIEEKLDIADPESLPNLIKFLKRESADEKFVQICVKFVISIIIISIIYLFYYIIFFHIIIASSITIRLKTILISN